MSTDDTQLGDAVLDILNAVDAVEEEEVTTITTKDVPPLPSSFDLALVPAAPAPSSFALVPSAPVDLQAIMAQMLHYQMQQAQVFVQRDEKMSNVLQLFATAANTKVDKVKQELKEEIKVRTQAVERKLEQFQDQIQHQIQQAPMQVVPAYVVRINAGDQNVMHLLFIVFKFGFEFNTGRAFCAPIDRDGKRYWLINCNMAAIRAQNLYESCPNTINCKNFLEALAVIGATPVSMVEYKAVSYMLPCPLKEGKGAKPKSMTDACKAIAEDDLIGAFTHFFRANGQHLLQDPRTPADEIFRYQKTTKGAARAKGNHPAFNWEPAPGRPAMGIPRTFAADKFAIIEALMARVDQAADRITIAAEPQQRDYRTHSIARDCEWAPFCDAPQRQVSGLGRGKGAISREAALNAARERAAREEKEQGSDVDSDAEEEEEEDDEEAHPTYSGKQPRKQPVVAESDDDDDDGAVAAIPPRTRARKRKGSCDEASSSPAKKRQRK